MRSGTRALAMIALVACTRQESPSPTAQAPELASSSAAGLAPGAPSARFVGRFDTTDPSGPRFAWEGTQIIARFKGTALSARLKDDGKNVFQAIVDGEPKATFKVEAGRDSYPLATGLPDGVHEVALYKRTEAEMGETVFLGFDPGPAKLLAPPGPLSRRIEFIGDSITAGYGNEGPGGVCPYAAMEQNEYATYAAITARSLSAEHVTVAWSGKTIKEMTDFYERTLPARPDSRWDFASWTPQVVVVNLGTNNFAVRDPGEGNFVGAYVALIDRVRKAYPDAFIACALGPMLSDVYPPGHNNLTLARRYLKTAVTKIKNAGEKNLDMIEFPEQKHSDGLGCGFHPSVKTHRLMADRLIPFIKEHAGW